MNSSTLHNPTVADPTRTADEDEEEDERDDEMPEPTQITSAEKCTHNTSPDAQYAHIFLVHARTFTNAPALAQDH